MMCVMSETSRQMNQYIAARRRGGLIEAVKGTDMGGARQDRLSAAIVRYEAARREGREVDAEMADAEIEAVLDEGRAARSPSNGTHAGQAPLAGTGFDGGVRRSVVRRKVGMNGVIAAAHKQLW
jgi:hypothetical protein